MSIEGIALVLRNLRSRIDFEPAALAAKCGTNRLGAGAGCLADIDAYDQALVSAAAMLEVPVPPPPPGDRRFDAAQRALVEADLGRAGIDVHAGATGP